MRNGSMMENNVDSLAGSSLFIENRQSRARRELPPSSNPAPARLRLPASTDNQDSGRASRRSAFWHAGVPARRSAALRHAGVRPSSTSYGSKFTPIHHCKSESFCPSYVSTKFGTTRKRMLNTRDGETVNPASNVVRTSLTFSCGCV